MSDMCSHEKCLRDGCQICCYCGKLLDTSEIQHSKVLDLDPLVAKVSLARALLIIETVLDSGGSLPSDVQMLYTLLQANGLLKRREPDHRARHRLLHKNLDELVADYISNNKKGISQTSIMELIQWSHSQTLENENERDGRCPAEGGIKE